MDKDKSLTARKELALTKSQRHERVITKQKEEGDSLKRVKVTIRKKSQARRKEGVGIDPDLSEKTAESLPPVKIQNRKKKRDGRIVTRKLAIRFSRMKGVSYEEAYQIIQKRIRAREQGRKEDSKKLINSNLKKKATGRVNKRKKKEEKKKRRQHHFRVDWSARRRSWSHGSEAKLSFFCFLCSKKILDTIEVPAGRTINQAKISLLRLHLQSTHGIDEIPVNHERSPSLDLSDASAPNILPWRPLPPDWITFAGLRNYYRGIEKELVTRYGHSVDYDRLEKIQSLGADQVYVGPDKFFGYLIYEFEIYKKVILECPTYGNAVYFLYKDRWHSQAQFSKRHIRETFPGEWRRVFHKGVWFSQIRRELSSNSF
jgi:hypothetical protein